MLWQLNRWPKPLGPPINKTPETTALFPDPASPASSVDRASPADPPSPQTPGPLMYVPSP